ncbi:ATP synthase F1 subunit delta [Bacteroidia bacterium]|nr:ATP synthase F1 subunit delta [Bacteroidia bacterium]
MASSRIASRYSKSLFDLAIQNNKLDEVKVDMTTIESMCHSSTDLIHLLKNPIIKSEAKKAIMMKLLKDTESVTQGFVSFLIDKKREEELAMIATHFIGSYNQMKGISQATVVTAIPLSDKMLTDAKKYVEKVIGKSDIQIINEIDSTIIGGIIIKYEDKLLDQSVSKELREIRKQLIYN